jgi:hypothetical protein
MPTRVEALAELERVFALIEAEFREAGTTLPDRSRACLVRVRMTSAGQPAAWDSNADGKLAVTNAGIIPTAAR